MTSNSKSSNASSIVLGLQNELSAALEREKLLLDALMKNSQIQPVRHVAFNVVNIPQGPVYLSPALAPVDANIQTPSIHQIQWSHSAPNASFRQFAPVYSQPATPNAMMYHQSVQQHASGWRPEMNQY